MRTVTTATKMPKKFRKVRLHKVVKELNLTTDAIVNYLTENGYASALRGNGLNAAITDQDAYLDLLDFFAEDSEMRARLEKLCAIREAELASSSADSASRSTQKTGLSAPQSQQDWWFINEAWSRWYSQVSTVAQQQQDW